MKRSFALFVLAVFVLALTLTACTPEEYGLIMISDPYWGQNVRNDPLTSPVQTTPLTVSSTYGTEKLVRFYVTGQKEPVLCLVAAHAVDQVCPPIPLSEPGRYTVTAIVDRIDGSESITDVDFSWRPYSNLDKAMLAWSFTDSPVSGYLVVYSLVLIAVCLITGLVTKDPGKVAASVACLTGALIVIVYWLPSAGLAVPISLWLVPPLLLSSLMAVKLIYFPGPKLVIVRKDGTELHYTSQPLERLKNSKPVVCHEQDLTAGLLAPELFIKKK